MDALFDFIINVRLQTKELFLMTRSVGCESFKLGLPKPCVVKTFPSTFRARVTREREFRMASFSFVRRFTAPFSAFTATMQSALGEISCSVVTSRVVG